MMEYEYCNCDYDCDEACWHNDFIIDGTRFIKWFVLALMLFAVVFGYVLWILG